MRPFCAQVLGASNFAGTGLTSGSVPLLLHIVLAGLFLFAGVASAQPRTLAVPLENHSGLIFLSIVIHPFARRVAQDLAAGFPWTLLVSAFAVPVWFLAAIARVVRSNERRRHAGKAPRAPESPTISQPSSSMEFADSSLDPGARLGLNSLVPSSRTITRTIWQLFRGRRLPGSVAQYKPEQND